MSSKFYIPNVDYYTTEQVIKKSRFIANLKKVQSKDEALEFITSIKEQYKDARHNCWAYLTGNPNSPSSIGYSDDGEPKGTAGPPILNVIQKKNVSMTAIVVTRYFGGVKLGASGLVRAYSGTANNALEEIALKEYIKTVQIKILFDYPFLTQIQNFLKQNNIETLNTKYMENITFTLNINSKFKDLIISQLTELTKGSIRIGDQL